MTDRRAFLTAALIAPVAIAAPVAAQTLVCAAADPIPEYIAAFHAYDEHDAASVERHTKAAVALHQWEPTTAQDMLRKIVVTLDDNAGWPETSLTALIRQADRMLEEI